MNQSSAATLPKIYFSGICCQFLHRPTVQRKDAMAKALKVEQGAPPLHTSGRYRWIVCALPFFATTINYMDRQILSLLKPILDNQMGWTNEQFGAINSAFQGAYAVGGLGFGWLVDRIGSKIGYSISITTIYSIVTVLSNICGRLTRYL